MKVRLCDKNKGKNKIKKALKEDFPDLDVKVKSCISMCGDCSKKKIALVNGDKVTASDTENLCKKIGKSVKGE
jgi:uncharacterized protein YuzB (UPF0349 family)